MDWKQDQPERQVLKLSDAFEGEGDIEVKVTMLNINYGKNQKLLDACEPLKEYAWLVDAVRRHQSEKMNLDAAVDTAIDEMPEGYVIRKFLVANRGEIKNMFLTEYNQEKVLEKERAEAQEETSRLFNFLWKNGRGADAEKAEKDADYRLSLLEKFRAGKLAPD